MIKLPSDPSSICMLESYVQNVVEKFKLKPDLYGNILISLTEAVNNAIIHGNGADESKSVEIIMEKADNCLSIQVSDQGRGFDYQNLPDPTAPDNLTRIGGRGVFLMRELSDKIQFYNNGSTVEMRFNIL